MEAAEAQTQIRTEDEPRFRSVEIAASVLKVAGAVSVVLAVLTLVGAMAGGGSAALIGAAVLAFGGIFTYATGGVLDVLLSIEYHVRRTSLRSQL